MILNKRFTKTLSMIIVLALSLGLITACGGGNTTTSSQQPSTAPQQSASAPEQSSTAPQQSSTAPSQNAQQGSSGPASTEPAQVEKQTLKIGIATCFTGAQARNAEGQLNGLQVALDQIAASGYSKYYDFELYQADDQFDATEAINAANRLVYQDGIKVVFGHLSAVHTLAALPIYEEAKVPCFTPSGSSTTIIESGFQYVYVVVPVDAMVAKTVIDYLVDELKITKVGMLYCNNEQGQTGTEAVAAALALHNMEITDKESFVVGDTDYTGQMLNFKQAGVEVVITWGGDVTQRGTMIQQARQIISPDILIAGEGTYSNASFISTTTPEVRNGVIFGVPWSSTFNDDLSKKFIDDFVKLDSLNELPSAVAVRFYDGMFLLANALNALGPYDVNAADFPEKLNEQLKLASFEGLQGTIKPLANGETISRCFVARFTMDGEERLTS